MNNQLSFSVTPYQGFEDEIRDLLDHNRSSKHTRQYLDWRYLEEETPHLPLIFWLRLPSGKAVGVASLISRPYWVNGHASSVWVLGDIALNADLRGKGLGRKLFKFMNSYIEKNFSNFVFVIANESAQKSLAATGWNQFYPFNPLVLVIDPLEKMLPNLRNNFLFKLLRVCSRQFLSMWFSLHTFKSNLRLAAVSCFDKSFNKLWLSLDKRTIIIRDRSQTSLNWRFDKHPQESFQIHKALHLNKMVGYIISTHKKRKCQIVDLVALKVKYVRPIVALFLKEYCKIWHIQTVRIRINEDNTYVPELKKLGFIHRYEKKAFQVYNSKEIAGLYNWFVTEADKDI